MLNTTNIEQLENPITIESKDGRVLEFTATADFDFNSFVLNALMTSANEAYFIAQDVTAILEYSDTYEATKKLRKQDKFVITEFATCLKPVANFDSKVRNITLISETGLYDILAGATRKPKAKPFRYWLFDEVLPNIRKYGIYILEERLKELEPKDLVELLSEMNPDADVIEDGGDLLVCAKDIKSNLGYKSTNAITYRLREGTHFKKFNRIIYINNSGLKIVIERSRKSEAANIAKLANLNVVKEVPEATVVGEVIQTFGRKFKIDDQKPFHFEGKTCKVDLFFPELNLAFEVDEENHKDRDPDYEKRRQEHMEKTLGWKVIRVNPHDKMFTTGYACGLIFDFIFDYMKKVNKNPLKHITK